MKKLTFITIAAIILTVSSCKEESNINSVLNIKAVGYIGEQTTRSSLAGKGLNIDTLLFNGDNIEWYNATTSEVKFKNNPEGNYFWSVFGGLVSIIVCLDEVELFTLDAIGSYSSVALDHPILILGGENPDGFYIGRGYPNWKYWTEEFWTETEWDKKADWVKERENNWKAIEPGWNMFIEQLKKEGKYRK